MGTGSIDLSFLGTVMTHLTPLLNRVLPLVGLALILGRLLNIVKK